MKTLQEFGIEFSQDVQQDVRYVINTYGSGDHPWCDSKTLPYFTVEYVIKCITNACKRRIIEASPRADEATTARLMSAMDTIKNAVNTARKVETLQ